MTRPGHDWEVYRRMIGIERAPEAVKLQIRPALLDLLEEEGLDVRRNYSGRGMYGNQCVGIVARDFWDIASVLQKVRETAVDCEDKELLDFMGHLLATKPSRDNMALNTIFYWEDLTEGH